MARADLLGKIRDLMAAGQLPNEPPVIHSAGDTFRKNLGAPCLICGEPAPNVAYFWTGGRVANLHAACDALWKLEYPTYRTYRKTSQPASRRVTNA